MRKSFLKLLLATVLIFSFSVLPVSAAETQEVSLISGDSGYKILVPNFIDVRQVEVNDKAYVAIFVGVPEKNSDGTYDLFELQTTDPEAEWIYSYPTNLFEQIGDFEGEFENGSLVFSPTFYDGDIDIVIQYGEVFAFDFYVVNKNGETYRSFVDINFVFVEGEEASETPSETAPAAEVEPEAEPEPASVELKEVVAQSTASKVLVNGADISFEAYNIDGFNYFKLRDLAKAVTGSDKQFEVAWDAEKSAINLVSGEAYTSVGGEFAAVTGTASIQAVTNQSEIYLDGAELSLEAYTIDGNNYFKLRDVAEVFDFGVSWDEDLGQIAIDTAVGYTAE